jgi:hypothetical protein
MAALCRISKSTLTYSMIKCINVYVAGSPLSSEHTLHVGGLREHVHTNYHGRQIRNRSDRFGTPIL